MRPIIHSFAAAARLMRTVRPLKTRQISARLFRRLRLRPSVAGPHPSRRENLLAWKYCQARKMRFAPPQRFTFGGIEDDLATCGWNDESKSRLWLYNAHYFDDLRSGSISSDLAMNVVRRWIVENPVGHGVGWEPYTLSLRIVNWLIWIDEQGVTDETVLRSVVHQVRFLRQRVEYHLLGNHLLANAKALVFAGCFFNGEEAEDWLAEGLCLLASEHQEQILSDGAHFELSPMYHAIILEDVLDLVQLGLLSGGLINASTQSRWVCIATSMLGWLASMTHPDGEISFFNDAATGIAAHPSNLVAYAKALGITASAATLSVSGYRRLENDTFCVLFDGAEVGPSYLPGHAHADTLSFEMSVDACRVVVNGGTSTYESGPVREAERSTAAHASLVIDAQNSSEVWASFRVGRRARIIDRVDGASYLSAVHDGYRFLAGSPLHRRHISMSDAEVVVRDEVTGKGGHHLSIVLPLHPSIRIESVMTDGAILQLPNNRRLRATIKAPSLQFDVREAHYASEFGKINSTSALVAAAFCALPIEIETRFEVLG